MTTRDVSNHDHQTAATAPGSATVGRRRTTALRVLQVLLALVFLMSAMPKLVGDPEAVEGFAAIGFSHSVMYVIGVLEVAAAVALLIPRLCGPAAWCLRRPDGRRGRHYRRRDGRAWRRCPPASCLLWLSPHGAGDTRPPISCGLWRGHPGAAERAVQPMSGRKSLAFRLPPP